MPVAATAPIAPVLGASKLPVATAAPKHQRFQAGAILLLALIGYSALAVLINIGVWRSPATRFIGVGGDPQQTMWFLRWTSFAVAHGHNPLLSDYMRYPHGISLLWQTSVPAPSLALAPVMALWGPIVTYNVLMTGGLALGAWSGFIAIRRFVKGNVAAALGGLIYGFSPFAIAQSQGHTHLIASLITPPLLLLLMHDLLVRQQRRPTVLGLLIAGVATLQFFTAEEVLATEVLMCVVMTVVLAALHRKEVRRRMAYVSKTLLTAAAVLCAVLAYPLAVQFLGPDRVSGVIHDPQAFVTDPFNFLIPTHIQWADPHFATSLSSRFAGNISEQDGYLGLPLIALGIFALIRYWRVPLIRATGLCALIISILSLGGFVHLFRHSLPIPLPWFVAEHIPVLENILPSRMMMYFYLGAGILVAFALHRLWNNRGKRWLAVPAAVLVLIPLLPHVPLDSSSTSSPAYFTTSAVNRIPVDTVALSIPWAYNNNTEPMNEQAAANMRFRLLGGYYIGDDDPAQRAMKKTVDNLAQKALVPSSSARLELLSEMRSNGVGAVIVNSASQQAPAIAFFTGLFGSPTQTYNDMRVWVLPKGY